MGMDPLEDKIRVVVADDHGVVRSGVARWLDKEADFEVVGQARNGKEALRLVHQHQPDVLLSDIEMPDLRGLDLVKIIRKKHPDVRVVLMTVYKGWYLRDILEAGSIGYLTKEAEREMFVLAIRWAAEGRAWIDPEELTAEMRRKQELARLGLTPTEQRILQIIDLPNAEIAARLGMKETTLRKAHLSNIFFKIGVNKRQEAIQWATQRRLIERTTGT